LSGGDGGVGHCADGDVEEPWKQTTICNESILITRAHP
jgi:hypothetical protein